MYSNDARESHEGICLPLSLTVEAARQYQGAVDLAWSLEGDRASLEPIRKHLVHKGQVNEERSEQAVTGYLQFLLLALTTGEPVAPSEEADSVWHTHILFTRLYEPFCRRHFGKFVHHLPSDPEVHPPDGFLKKQNQLGALFFGRNSIYVSKAGNCHNSHGCHSCHTCTVHIRQGRSSEPLATAVSAPTARCASCTANG